MRLRVCKYAFWLMFLFAAPSAAQIGAIESWGDSAAPSLGRTRTEARAGKAEAQNRLGTWYYRGSGVSKDRGEAERWFLLAAKQGYAVAQNNLGLLYTDTGKSRNYTRAIYWYRKAAGQGSEVAQYNLGLMHRYGKGVKRDYVEAAYWIEMSAVAGYAVAQNSIANMYRKGMGVERNTDRALRWYQLAATNDLPMAQFNLGKYYLTHYISRPTKEIHAKAMRWLKTAGENNEVNAQGTLGSIYERGHGITIDHARAWMWFSLAAGNGSNRAGRRLAILETKMKPDELNLARQMLADWRRWVHAEFE